MNTWWLLGLLIGMTVLASILIIYPLKRRLLASLFLVPLIFILAFSGYFYWGSFAKWQNYLDHQQKQQQAVSNKN